MTLARALDDAFDVVLLERRDRFYHNVGAMRAYADASFFKRLLIPYDRLLRRGRVVQDEAVLAEGGGVRGVVGRYEGYIVVVASGSRHRVATARRGRRRHADLSSAVSFISLLGSP